MVHLSASLLLGGYLSLAANGLALPEIEPRGDVLHARSSWNFMTWTGPTGQTVKLTPGADLHVLHYLPTNWELFFSANQQPWHRYQNEGLSKPVAESLVGFADLTGLHAYNGLTAIARTSSDMEVFYYSEGDNVIHSRFWTSGGGWGNSGVDKAIQAAPGTHIEGISRESSHMEIFYVGTNGNLMHSYTTNSGSNWVIDQDFVDGAHGKPTNKGFGALTRNDQSAEVWWITTDGAINYAPWDPLNSWEYGNLRAAGTAHTSSGMAVLARSNVRKNIFYIGKDNKVYQGYWKSEQPTIWTFEKLSDLTAAPGSLTAVSMNSQHMEVFWTAPDGSVNHAYWYESTGKWTSSSLAGSGIRCVPGSSITSTSRKDGCMDIFCATSDGYTQQFSYF